MNVKYQIKIRQILNNSTLTNHLHKWLYDNKEIESNLELTKSLKQIQSLLEETIHKKYTISKMRESFQDPLTRRLAFREQKTTCQVIIIL